MRTPLVSIVIPTLNRAHLLRSSLKSSTDQTFEDLEVLVFDDMSTDDTEDVVAQHGSARVRYVRSPSRLSMSRSFEAALEHAHGDYITFLTDDSYLLPNSIARAHAALLWGQVPLAAWRHAGYFDDDWVEPARRSTLYVPRVSHQQILLDSRKCLQLWFATIQGHSKWMPRSINSLCHRSVIESAKRAQGSFFLPPAPDHSSGVGMLMNTTSYVAIDDALVIDGVTKESVGPAQSFTRGKSADEFYKSLGATLEQATYLGLPTTSAIIAKSFERAAAAYPDAPQIRLQVVLRRINDDLAKLGAYGSDVTEFNAVLDDAAAKIGRSFALSIRLTRLRSAAKWRAVRAARSNLVLSEGLERIRGLRPVRGHDTGLSGIEDAARVLIEHSAVRRAAS